MDNGVVVQVTGLKELRAALRKMDTGLPGEMTKVHRRIADLIVGRAIPNVPVLTGRLRASVRAGATVRQAIGRAGGARVPYAAAIHWGYPARGIPARPFLRVAAEDVERKVVDIYTESVDDLIDRAMG